MKKLAKLSMFVALVGFAACTNDTTEDLANAPDFAGGGKSTLTVSIAAADVRTEMGEKTVDGKYPLYWSEGDVLSVNGEAVTVAIDADNAAVGEFTTTAEAPFNVVYPYVEGLEASVVRFADVQAYTEGTFAPASAPMYGYAESATAGVGMKHLTGIMRFAITSTEGVKLTAINVVANKPISGDFAIDCATGELTPLEGKASTSITYTFAEGEGLLAATASNFFIAVPAGAYEDISVTFVAEGGASMAATFDGSQIKAGVVREFKEVPFTNNGGEYLIYDEATLLAFAQKVAAGAFKGDVARVTASFEVSAETAAAWTPIEGFTKTLEGENKTISGMQKPLFGTVAGTINNLKIGGAYTVATGETFGALAVAATEGAVLDGCSLVEGSTIAVEGTTAGVTKVGGLVGDATATLANLTNYATITVAAECAEADLMLGGVAGTALCEITNCDNHGAVALGQTTLNNVYVGGVVGLLGAQLNMTYNIKECDNTAAVTIGESATCDLVNLGGVLGAETLNVDMADVAAEVVNAYTQTYTVDTCTNTGAVTFRGTISSTGETLYIGGVAGRAYGCYKNCANGVKDTEQGAVYVTGTVLGMVDNPESPVAHASILMGIGGLFGGNNGTTYARSDVDDCVNYAPISLVNLENTALYNETNVQTLRIGGLFGIRRNSSRTINLSYIRNCENYGKVTLKYNGSGLCSVTVGGLSGYCQVFTNTCTNHGEVECELNNVHDVYVGGVYGYDNVCAPTLLNNFGDISVKGVGDEGVQTATGTIYIGGIIGSSSWVSGTSSLNEGDITLTNYSTAGNIYIGGNIAIKSGTTNHPKPVNKGDITVRSSKCKTACIGGVSGDSEAAVGGDSGVYDGSSDYVTNSGTIDVELTATGNYYLSAGMAYTDGKSQVGVKNTGNIISNSQVEGITRIGGIVAYSLRHASQNTHKCCVNEGNITVTGSSGELFVGGCVADLQASNTSNFAQHCEQMRNSGNISTNLTTSTAQIVVGGAVSNAYNKVDEIHNSGTVRVEGAAGGTVHVGGAVCVCNRTYASDEEKTLINTNVHNTGDVYCSISNADDTRRNIYVGGGVAYVKSAFSNITNTGKIEAYGTAATPRVAGAVGYVPSGFNINTTVLNSGSVTCGTASTNTAYVGGGIGVTASTCDQVINEGPVTYSGVSGSYAYVGGAAGQCGTADMKYFENRATGVVKCSGQAAGLMGVGGCMGSYTLHLKQGGKNSATVEITRDASAGKEMCIGGIVGYVNAGNSKTLQNLINEGSVVCSGDAQQDCYVGGCVGYAASRDAGKKYTLTTLTNNGDRVRVNSTIAGNLYLGGIIGASDAVGSESGHTLGVNTVVEIGGGASVEGEIFQQDEYIGLIEADFLIQTLKN